MPPVPTSDRRCSGFAVSFSQYEPPLPRAPAPPPSSAASKVPRSFTSVTASPRWLEYVNHITTAAGTAPVRKSAVDCVAVRLGPEPPAATMAQASR